MSCFFAVYGERVSLPVEERLFLLLRMRLTYAMCACSFAVAEDFLLLKRKPFCFLHLHGGCWLSLSFPASQSDGPALHTRRTWTSYQTCTSYQTHLYFIPDAPVLHTRRTCTSYQTHPHFIPDAPALHTRRTCTSNQTCTSYQTHLYFIPDLLCFSVDVGTVGTLPRAAIVHNVGHQIVLAGWSTCTAAAHSITLSVTLATTEYAVCVRAIRNVGCVHVPLTCV